MSEKLKANARNLVIGTVHGYDFTVLRPFIRSLQHTGYDGDIVLLCDALSRPTKQSLSACGVKLHGIHCHGGGGVNSWSFYWPKFTPIARRFQALPITRFVCKALLPLLTARFLHYRDYLTKHRREYDKILLTDIRDVIFQRNPFVDFVSGIEAFQESGNVLLKEEKTNVYWISELFGPRVLSEIGVHPILCAGTIIGDVDSIIDLLKRFESLLYEAFQVYVPGSDQGVFNYLCRTQVAGNVRIIENGLGRVLTLGTLHLTDATLEWNAQGELLGADRLPVPIIHQYDRHPAIAQRLLTKIAAL